MTAKWHPDPAPARRTWPRWWPCWCCGEGHTTLTRHPGGDLCATCNDHREEIACTSCRGGWTVTGRCWCQGGRRRYLRRVCREAREVTA